MTQKTRSDNAFTLRRRELLAGMAAIPMMGMLGKPVRAQDYPTAEVNTTGLAVTDDTVTVGILHSVTGTRQNACAPVCRWCTSSSRLFGSPTSVASSSSSNAWFHSPCGMRALPGDEWLLHELALVGVSETATEFRL